MTLLNSALSVGSLTPLALTRRMKLRCGKFFKGDHNREIKIEFMTETERRSKEGGVHILWCRDIHGCAARPHGTVVKSFNRECGTTASAYCKYVFFGGVDTNNGQKWPIGGEGDKKREELAVPELSLVKYRSTTEKRPP